MRLTNQQIASGLEGLDGWTHAGTEIRKEFRFRDFAGAIDFVNSVAQLAEKADHHPDIRIKYNTVLLSLSTHSEGGITHKDISLAKEIDRI
ncbi:MAG: 4a-hydroxytetrahydrobiopterin dehydratase [Candidatus Aenigmarchaeota archaeon]|nr:4a-hydroxytetrahydrobiopterin dehydratase [Candidatus Aenigmarchaeota archaeon]